ncbi:hypothetical protein EQG63_05175 [Flavobacterium amnicola]|uniref:Outer membrane protein beta-barrel domain-containing protein n=1 Tax=Flavobacterium amnicola TaxID=2506422 RepID=A0A4Q1K5Y0_9FLAO|nr:outer membrane beta-barrel protein [Flavobacterium amnicola]RXR21333.1 hypothetical protein EQG63_05175 [Flavobacterium amnicola]
MKKLILSLATISLFAVNANAQIKQGPYASFSIGYNFASNANSNAIYGDTFQFYNSDETPGPDRFETIKLSLGKGVNFSGQFGYMFNKNIGAEMGIGYVMGAETSANQNSSNGSGWNRSELTLKANQLQIKPALVLAAGYSKINPYAKLGLVVGMGKTIFTNNQSDSTGDVGEYEVELTGGTMIGIRASAGLNFAINDKVSLFAELTSISGNIKPSEGKFTKATVNGVDVLPMMTYNDSNIVFEDEITTAGPELDSQPHKAIKPSFSANSLGLNFGVAYHF